MSNVVEHGRKNTKQEALESANKNKIFFPTDDDCIVMGGKAYGDQTKIREDLVAETARAMAAENANAQAIAKRVIYDVSAYNNGAVFESLLALLNNANLSTLIPTSVRCGGMSIRFIQGTEQGFDNKYVQFRLMATSFSTTEADWQGVDDEPIAGSDNLVKSGGIVRLYGGKVDLQFETIQSVYLAEDVPFIAKKGDTINFQLNALNLIDDNGITIRLLKNENVVQSSYANNTSWISALLTSDIDTIRVTRSANGIIGTGTASLSVKYENPFYTKEETNALIPGIQSSMIISKQDDNTKATEKIIQNNQVVAEYGKQIDIFRFASGGSAKREFNVTSDNRRFTINFPIIKDRKYRIVFSGATSSAAYNIEDATDGSTVIFGGDAYSTSIAKFTAQNSYENIQIYFSSSMLFPQVISMDIFDITNEGLNEDIERLNKKVIGDAVDISSLAIPSETAGFYTGSVGGYPQFMPIVNSIAYNPIDLTEYVGNKVKVSLQNPIDNSERYTLICDSDEISTAVIGQLISEDEIYEYGEAVFDITEKYKYLWISNRNDSGTVTIKIHQEATLKSEIEKEILNDIDQTINNRIAYVSPNGSDTNDGKTENTPVKTINKALSLANKIRLLEGIYIGETVNLNSYPYNEVEIKGQDAKKVVIDFKSSNPYLVNDGSETLVSGYTKVYQVTCNTFPFADGATNAFMWQDYVNDQNTLITEQDRHPLQRGRQYRCDSTKIKQVASIAAIEALSENEFGWYWENGIMYFSRPQISSIEHPIVIPKRDARFIELQGNWIVRKQIKLTLNNIEVRYGNINISYTSNCELADVLVKYPYISNGGCFYIYAATNCKLIRCEAAGVTNGESIGDGFNVDTAGTADNATCTCLSLYMRDCWAHDIWDDGYSDHDNSEVTIDGGLFEYCGKGGLTPSYGSNDVIKNAVCRYNRGAGILATGTPQVSRINTNVLAQNCLCYGQQYGFKSDNGCNLKCVSCLSKDNQVGYGGTGKVYCYDCSSSNDVSQKDSNVVVLSFNKISS